MKAPCPVCSRPIDARGMRAHRLTHKTNGKNVARETPDRKRGPVSVDLASFRLGFSLGRETAKEVA
jgi:hypothetical protein